MTVTLPPLVQTRQSNWQAKPSVSLEARQELADFVWEKWNAGQWDIPLPSHIEAQAEDLKKEKDRVHPSDDGKLAEEWAEVLDATGAPQLPELMQVAIARYLNPYQFEDMQNMLGMPIDDPAKYMQAAIWKLQGRVEANKRNPEATSDEIKAALKDYEAQSARRAFDMMA